MCVCVSVWAQCTWGKVFMSQHPLCPPRYCHTPPPALEQTGAHWGRSVCVCMCACPCVRDNSRSAYWQVYVSPFPVLRQHVAFSDTCLSFVCVQERAVPLKKCPTGERWTNSRAANKENWIYWLSAPREGWELSVFCEKGQINGGEKEWRGGLWDLKVNV